jgi:hypothetical protein
LKIQATIDINLNYFVIHLHHGIDKFLEYMYIKPAQNSKVKIRVEMNDQRMVAIVYY